MEGSLPTTLKSKPGFSCFGWFSFENAGILTSSHTPLLFAVWLRSPGDSVIFQRIVVWVGFLKQMEPSHWNNIMPLQHLVVLYKKTSATLTQHSVYFLFVEAFMTLTQDKRNNKERNDSECGTFYYTNKKNKSISVSSCQLLKYGFHLSLLRPIPIAPFPYLLIFECYH